MSQEKSAAFGLISVIVMLSVQVEHGSEARSAIGLSSNLGHVLAAAFCVALAGTRREYLLHAFLFASMIVEIICVERYKRLNVHVYVHMHMHIPKGSKYINNTYFGA